MKSWQEEFSKKVKCWCPCHTDVNNVFSFRDGIHCDKCYEKRILEKLK